MNLNHLKFICTELQLGSPDGVPTRVYGSRGGSLMWRISTEKGGYAIKQLAPAIDLKNEMVVTKYELSETIAYRFKQQGIPAISAIEKSGRRIFIIENIGYLVYPWIEGYTLDRVSETHALKIAELIAKLHSINLNMPEIGPPRFDIHTNESIVEAIDRAVSCKCPFAKTLKEKQSLILSVNDSYQAAIPLLSEDTVITHGDVDQLNVLWDKADQPILIDWESARRMNPTREIVRASLGWSGEDFPLPIFSHMMRTYIKSGGMFNLNHLSAALYGIFGSMINWMLYNIEAASGKEERETGIKEVNRVLVMIMQRNILIPDLLRVFQSSREQ